MARHGQDEDNANGLLNGRRDSPLTEKGREQAQEIAVKMLEAGIVIDVVLSSPLSRALETASIISQVNGFVEPKILPELIERDFGSVTGVDKSRVGELCAPDILETETITYFLSPEGAETFPDLLKRAEILLETIEERWADRRVLLVTHGDFGKMIYAQYYGLAWQDVLRLFHFGNSELIHLSPGLPSEKVKLFSIDQYNT